MMTLGVSRKAGSHPGEDVCGKQCKQRENMTSGQADRDINLCLLESQMTSTKIGTGSFIFDVMTKGSKQVLVHRESELDRSKSISAGTAEYSMNTLNSVKRRGCVSHPR